MLQKRKDRVLCALSLNIKERKDMVDMWECQLRNMELSYDFIPWDEYKDTQELINIYSMTNMKLKEELKSIEEQENRALYAEYDKNRGTLLYAFKLRRETKNLPKNADPLARERNLASAEYYIKSAWPLYRKARAELRKRNGEIR